VDKDKIAEDLVDLAMEIENLPLENAERSRLLQLVGTMEQHLIGEPVDEKPQEVVDAVDAVISAFETDHPTMTGIARRLMAALSSLGV
jgi:HPt (histidine-containing phosphotransfer) domain-containing protein